MGAGRAIGVVAVRDAESMCEWEIQEINHDGDMVISVGSDFHIYPFRPQWARGTGLDAGAARVKTSYFRDF